MVVCVCVLMCKIMRAFGSQDELWSNSTKRIKLDTNAMNGGGVTATATSPEEVNNGGGTLESGIRRSARNRRPRGELIVVSSNDTLLDLKMKVSQNTVKWIKSVAIRSN